MNRIVTAADFTKLAFVDRLPLIVQFRQASVDRRLSPAQRAMYRLAARYMMANLDNPAYDLLARLQVLESAAKVVTPKPMVAGPWSKNPRQGVKAAQDHYGATAIDPVWFSTGNTGFIGKILGMVRQEVNKFTRGRDTFFNAEDIIQNGLMGLTKDGTELLGTGPLLIHFGYTYPNLYKTITSGRVTPHDLAGVAAKNFVKKIQDQFQMGDKARVPTETPQGTNILDMHPGTESEVSFSDFLQGLLSSGSSAGRKLEQKMRSLAGDNIVANELINRLVSGADIGSISSIHKDLGGSGSGGAVVWTKEKFYPAVAKLVQNDPDLLAAYSRVTGRMASRKR